MQIKEVHDNSNLLEVFMVHKLVVSKLHPYEGFEEYINEIRKEFNHEMTRLVMPGANLIPTRSHVVEP